MVVKLIYGDLKLKEHSCIDAYEDPFRRSVAVWDHKAEGWRANKKTTTEPPHEHDQVRREQPVGHGEAREAVRADAGAAGAAVEDGEGHGTDHNTHARGRKGARRAEGGAHGGRGCDMGRWRYGAVRVHDAHGAARDVFNDQLENVGEIEVAGLEDIDESLEDIAAEVLEVAEAVEAPKLPEEPQALKDYRCDHVEGGAGGADGTVMVRVAARP